jgi:hypothetical protein
VVSAWWRSRGGDATVSVNGCDVGVPTPLVAVRLSAYVPPLPDAAVPLSIALPFPLSVNIRPVGSVPDSLKDGVGVPVVVTVKLPAAPTVKIALLALVIVGAVLAPLPPTLFHWPPPPGWTPQSNYSPCCSKRT